MSGIFDQFNNFSKGLYGAVIALDITAINALIAMDLEVLPLVISRVCFLISILTLITGLLISCFYTRDEGKKNYEKITSAVNKRMFKWLFLSALFSLTGLVFLIITPYLN
jgi:hypothetical protein